MVYVSLTIFLGGVFWRVRSILARLAFAPSLAVYPRRKPGWLAALIDAFALPTVFRLNKPFWLGLILFHAGLGLLIIGHLELVGDFKLLQLWPHAVFLGKGFVVLTLLLCLVYFLGRRLVSPTKDISVPEDFYLLVLLFLCMLFGAQMDWARAWFDYSSLSLPDYRAYFRALFSFNPNLGSIPETGHGFMFVAHVFFANLILMVFPFSKFMHAMFGLALQKIRRG